MSIAAARAALKEYAEKAGPNKVAGRQPRLSDGRFLKFGGFASSKRNQKPAGPGNKFSDFVRRQLQGRSLSREKYRAAVERFRALYNARRNRNRDEAKYGRGGEVGAINRVFGGRAKPSGKKKKEVDFEIIQKEGQVIWQLVASTPYGPDRDGEWVTEKALKEFADSFTPDREIPLVWWHLFDFDTRIGVVLGKVKEVIYVNDALVMAGDFVDQSLGQELLPNMNMLGSSIGFQYRLSNKQANEYHEAQIYEVSLLPKERASNPYTVVEIGVPA